MDARRRWDRPFWPRRPRWSGPSADFQRCGDRRVASTGQGPVTFAVAPRPCPPASAGAAVSRRNFAVVSMSPISRAWPTTSARPPRPHAGRHRRTVERGRRCRPGRADTTSSPGATTSGLTRRRPGPRLEKSRPSPPGRPRPTVNTSAVRGGRVDELSQDGPLFPAAATTKMPAAAARRWPAPASPASQPSRSGQPHELVSTCGARSGSAVVERVAAVREGREHELQAVQVADGLPRFRSQVHAADPLGAAGPPRCRRGRPPVPMVCVPCPPWSVGVAVPFHGSYQESSPPAESLAQRGMSPSTPESECRPRCPGPVTPSCRQPGRRRSARCSTVESSVGAGSGCRVPSVQPAGSGRSRWSSRTRSTSERPDSHARTAGPPSTTIAVDQVVRRVVQPEPVQVRP